MKEKIQIKNLAVVSVPTTLFELEKATGKKCERDEKIPQGEIFELAIINKEANTFALVRDAKNERALSECSEPRKMFFKKREFVNPGKDVAEPVQLFQVKVGKSSVNFTESEIKFGVPFEKLVRRNNFALSMQLRNYLFNKTKEPPKQKGFAKKPSNKRENFVEKEFVNSRER